MTIAVPITPRPMRDAVLLRIHEAMQKDTDIFFVTADFGSPVLDKIRADYPDRFINVGIAEQNLINVSAGLALEGFKVFAYAIAPFITMRCYEQIRVSLALLSEVRRMNVTLIGVGAGYSYVVSGPTHQCFEDITLMRALPNVSVYSSADHISAAALFDACIAYEGPSYLRLDAQILPVIYPATPDITRGFEIHRKGVDICLVATGYMLHTALQVADRLSASGIEVGVIDLFAISGMQEDVFKEAIKSYQGLVTMEEGFRGRGGVDALLFDFNVRHGMGLRVMNIGVKPAYQFELGTRAVLHEKMGIGLDASFDTIARFSKNIAASPRTKIDA